MLIEQDGNTRITCDKCKQSESVAPTGKHNEWFYLMGWRTANGRKGWLHLCSGCVAKRLKFKRKCKHAL